jgi:hypothetical protein
MRLQIYKGRIMLDMRDCNGFAVFHAEACILDVKRFTASSISIFVFRRTFKLVFYKIELWKLSQLM